MVAGNSRLKHRDVVHVSPVVAFSVRDPTLQEI